MDEILHGIFESTHPENFKKLLFIKIADASKTNTDKSIAEKVLEKCSTRLQEELTFNSEMAKLVFEKWALTYPVDGLNCIEKALVWPGLKEKDSPDLLDSISRKLYVVHFIFGILKQYTDNVFKNSHTKDDETLLTVKRMVERVIDRLVQVYMDSTDSCTLERISIIMVEHWETWGTRISNSPHATEICEKSLSALNDIKIDSTAAESFSVPRELKADLRDFEANKNEFKQAKSIANFVGKVLESHRDYLEFVLNKLFSLLASDVVLPGLCLAAVLQYLPSNAIDNAMIAVSQDVRIKNENLFLVLNRMISWLRWPSIIPIDIWIVQLMKALFNSNRSEVVFKTIELQSVEVSKNLFHVVCQQETLTVLSSMVLCYQHSPDVFHRILSRMVLFIKCLQLKDDAKMMETAQIAADLIHVMMYHFPGHDKKYADAMEVLKDFARPAEDKMKRWLHECLHLKGAEENEIVQFPEKPPSQKTGLQNLGNTCYINSVTQALFMLHSFRQEVLQRKWVNHSQPLSSSLQKLFSALLATKRLAVNPRGFVDASRPPWFNKGSQQDCSEFLKYMLDRLEEEDPQCEAVSSSLHRQFIGECRVETRCSLCGTVTSRTEAFNDLPLSFPVAEHPTDGADTSKGLSTLKGGELLRNQGNSYHAKGKDRDRSSTEGQGSWMPTQDEFGKSSTPLTSASGPVESTDTPLQLEDLISHSLSREVLSGVNQFKCDACQRLCDAERQLYLTRMPKYLVLTLKRFTYNAKLKTRNKIMTEVKYPVRIEIPETCPSGLSSFDTPNTISVDVDRGGSFATDDEAEGSQTTARESSTDVVTTEDLNVNMDVDKGTLPYDNLPSSSSDSPGCLKSTNSLISESELDQTACSSKSSQFSSLLKKLDLEQDVSKRNLPNSRAGNGKSRNATFVLSAVIVHSGMSSDSGHYYCFCRENIDCASSRDNLNAKKQCLSTEELDLTKTEHREPVCRSPARDASLCSSSADQPMDIENKPEDQQKVSSARKRMSADQVHTEMKWILFNDSSTTYRDFESMSSLNIRHPNDTPYVLIYENLSTESIVFPNEVHCREDLQVELQALLDTDDRLYAQELGSQRRRSRSKPFTSNSFWKDDNDQDKGGPSSGCGGPLGPGLNLNGGRFIF